MWSVIAMVYTHLPYPSVQALGFNVTQSSRGVGSVHLHPSSLTSDRSFRLGPALVTPGMQPGYLTAIFTSIMTASVP